MVCRRAKVGSFNYLTPQSENNKREKQSATARCAEA